MGMTPTQFLTEIIDDALVYLAAHSGPSVTPAARTLLLAIALQESGPQLEARYQSSPGNTPGPARGFWQFEKGGGVQGVLQHPASGKVVNDMCARFAVVPNADHVWRAIEGHDRLACICARMLLYTDPKPLPTTQDEGWSYYQRNWRPGRPHQETWANNWRIAKETVGA
jgi:hypothetical protein